MTGAKDKQEAEQSFDGLQVEKERGITVKAKTCTMFYKHTDGQTYLLNLIDTPVKFHSILSRDM